MSKRRPLPDFDRLHELFSYEPETGHLRWKIGRAQMKAGDIAGHPGDVDGGYVKIGVDGKIYRAHLLIWKMVTGKEPIHQIDHENMIKHDNRWRNLREATESQNRANTGLLSSNKSGLKGVSRYSAGAAYGKPWQASIQINGKTRYIGHFSTKEAAHAAYAVEADKLFGKFARVA